MKKRKKRQLLITLGTVSVSFYLGTEGHGYTVAKVTGALLGKKRVRRALKQYDNVVRVARRQPPLLYGGCVRSGAGLDMGYDANCPTCTTVRKQVKAILKNRNVLRKPIVL